MNFFIVLLILNFEAIFSLVFNICSYDYTEPCLSNLPPNKGISFCFQSTKSFESLTISSQANSEYKPWELPERGLSPFNTFITVPPDQLNPNDWNQVTLQLDGQSYDAPYHVLSFTYTVNKNQYSVKVPVYEKSAYLGLSFFDSKYGNVFLIFNDEWIGSRNFTSPPFDSSSDIIYSGNGIGEDNEEDEESTDLLTNCVQESTPDFLKARDNHPTEEKGSSTTTDPHHPIERAFGLSPKGLITLYIVTGISLAMISSIISILSYKMVKRCRLKQMRNDTNYYEDPEYDDPVKRPVSLGVKVNQFFKGDDLKQELTVCEEEASYDKLDIAKADVVRKGCNCEEYIVKTPTDSYLEVDGNSTVHALADDSAQFSGALHDFEEGSNASYKRYHR